MIRRPPRSTRTDTLFPYTTLCRSKVKLVAVNTSKTVSEAEIQGMTITIEQLVDKTKGIAVQNTKLGSQVLSKVVVTPNQVTVTAQGQSQELPAEAAAPYQSLLTIFPELTYATDGVTLELDRSEERRVGKECVSTGRARWSP